MDGHPFPAGPTGDASSRPLKVEFSRPKRSELGAPPGPYGGRDDRGYDRGRGYDDRGRGYDDRSRGYDDRGYDRSRGYDDRGRGYGYEDRGFDDRGRGGGGGRGYDDRRDTYSRSHDDDSHRRDVHRSSGDYGRSSRAAASSGGRAVYRVLVTGLAGGASWQDLKDLGRRACRSATSGQVNFTDVKEEAGEGGRRGPLVGVIEFSCEDDMRWALKNLDGERVRGVSPAPANSRPSAGPLAGHCSLGSMLLLS